MDRDALVVHAREELGISEITTARPVQAALTSAATFSVGAAMPLLMVVVSPANVLFRSCRPRLSFFLLFLEPLVQERAVPIFCAPQLALHFGGR